jgi:hypothetical protein
MKFQILWSRIGKIPMNHRRDLSARDLVKWLNQMSREDAVVIHAVAPNDIPFSQLHATPMRPAQLWNDLTPH